jgi:DNA-binding response OmpR family regulator
LIPHSSPGNTGRILIDDRSLESRQVLRTVLERRGITIWEASGARRGLELARQHHPDVIILDWEGGTADDDSACAALNAHADAENSSLVVLGTLPAPSAAMPTDRVVPKPYHYGPLVRKIEQLLDRTVRTSAEPRSGISLRHSGT